MLFHGTQWSFSNCMRLEILILSPRFKLICIKVKVHSVQLQIYVAGEVSWEEYHAYFLRSHGYLESYVNSHDKKHSDLSRTLKENIMRDRARWAEAARNDPDRLALDEFLAFTHPESSHRALLQMVEDLFEKFGKEVFHPSSIFIRSCLIMFSLYKSFLTKFITSISLPRSRWRWRAHWRWVLRSACWRYGTWLKGRQTWDRCWQWR